MPLRLIVHGGAWNIPSTYEADHLAGVEKALHTAWPLLHAGASAVETVVAAVKVMEEDPTFDAGRGAFLNSQGQIELDAMVMDGTDLNFGAVAALQNILHPVEVALHLMKEAEFKLLVGAGAQTYAQSIGINEVPMQALLTKRELEFFDQIKADEQFQSHHPFREWPSDTVGAVAMDAQGRIAAATSTGGTPRKWPGRVGDSPIPGAGAYADNQAGGISATGWGESILKVLLSKQVTDRMQAGLKANAAAVAAIRYLKERVDGRAGVVGIDAKGRYAWAHNTPKMAFAYVTDNQEIICRIKAEGINFVQ